MSYCFADPSTAVLVFKLKQLMFVDHSFSCNNNDSQLVILRQLIYFNKGSDRQLREAFNKK